MITAKYPHWLVAALIVAVVIVSTAAAIAITVTVKDVATGKATPRDLLILVGSFMFVIGFGVGLIFAESAQSDIPVQPDNDELDNEREYRERYGQMIWSFLDGQISRDELFRQYTED